MLSFFFVHSIFATVRRFPFETLAGLLFSIIGILTVHAENALQPQTMLSIVLLFALLLCGSVMAENYQQKFSKWHWIWIIFSMIVSGFSAFALSHSTETEFLFIQHFLWIISLLFASIVVGFSRKTEEINRMWTAGESVIFAVLAAIFAGGVFFVGMLIFYLALDTLFGVSISSFTYADTWFLITGIISSGTFLSFFPKQEINNEPIQSSSFARIFSRYILLPLTLGYIAIMYGYTLKIIIEQTLPNGFLAGFIAGFSAVTLFTIYMLYGLRAQHSWISWISRIIAMLLIPQSLLMMWSIWVRINEYGITEMRYFGIGLAIYIFCTGVLWSFSKYFTIRKPIGMVILFLAIATISPLNAEKISLQSQTSRFIEVLAKYNLVENGHVVFPQNKPTFTDEDTYFLNTQIQYFFLNHSISALKNNAALLVPDDFDKNPTDVKMYGWDYANKYQEKFFLVDPENSMINENGALETSIYFHRDEEKTTIFESKNYDHVAHIKNYSSCENLLSFQNNTIVLTLSNAIQIDITQYLQEITAKPSIIPNDLIGETEKLRYTVHLIDFSGNKASGIFKSCSSFEGIILYSEK